nr:P2X purinoceptor 6 isoform X6 [Microcebus murinus]
MCPQPAAAGSMGSSGAAAGWGFLDYKTEKYVITKNWRVGALQRLLQLGIVAYVVGTPPCHWLTAGLTRTAPKGRKAHTAMQPPARALPRPCRDPRAWSSLILCLQGLKTGRCVVFNGTHKTCEIQSWCPVESGAVPTRPLLIHAQNFTLFIKNTVTFSKFNFSKSNALETRDPTYFKHCRYDPHSSPYCPVFRIEDLVAEAGGDFEDLALLGGSVGISVHWDCDLDTGGSDCRPHYSFQLQERNYNFRMATHWWQAPGVEARSLLKLYGIRFDILVTGEAGKFGLIPTAITLGTGAAWLGVVSLHCGLPLASDVGLGPPDDACLGTLHMESQGEGWGGGRRQVGVLGHGLALPLPGHFPVRPAAVVRGQRSPFLLEDEIRGGELRASRVLELRPLCLRTGFCHALGDAGLIPDLLSSSAGKGPEGNCQLSVEPAGFRTPSPAAQVP